MLSILAESLNEDTGAGGLPKYARLSEGIVRSIESGLLKTGDRLPSESEMTAELPASLGTVQKALNALADQGILVRRHGKGTFVGERAMSAADLWHYRFLAEDGETLLPVYTRVTALDASDHWGPWRAFLGADRCVRITRMIDVGHELSGLSFLYLALPRFRPLLDMPREDLMGVNIRAFLADYFDAPTRRVAEHVACQVLPQEVADRLDLPNGQLGLVYAMLGYGAGDLPLSYQTAYFPPSELRLAITENRGGGR